MTITLTIALGILGGLAAMSLALVLRPTTASAHCDTMEGPAVKDGLLALETGNANIALKWVHADGSDELRRIFEQAQAARRLGEEARLVADQWFLENMVRIHRAGEGAPYTGIEPVGAPVDARVRAAATTRVSAARTTARVGTRTCTMSIRHSRPWKVPLTGWRRAAGFHRAAARLLMDGGDALQVVNGEREQRRGDDDGAATR